MTPRRSHLDVAMVDPSLFTLPYDLALCEALRRRGCTVRLDGRKPRPLESIPGPTKPSASFYRFSEPLKGQVPNRVFHALKGIEHAADMTRLCRRLSRNPPSVVHFQWSALPTLDSVFLRYMRRHVGPVVLTAHDVAPFNNAPTSVLQRIGSTSVLREFDHLVVHSGSSKDALVRKGLAASRITVIPHGLLEMGKDDARAAGTGGPVNILLFGRIKAYKGIDLMVEALGRLPLSVRQSCRLLIVGEPMIPVEPIQSRAQALGVAELIEWDLRYVSEAEMAGVFGRADIFAFPYREIDTSGVLMSCLPFGKPIIATALGAFSKLLTDKVHGRIVPPEDAAALAQALHDLLTDQAACARCGYNVAGLAASIPSWDDIADQTIAMYQLLISGRSDWTVSSPAVPLTAA